VEAMPTSAILRRLQIVLSGGARPVVAAARQACPDDSDVWLADLVSGVREPGSRAWVTNDIRAATAAPRFSVETMVRAGHYLLRTNMVDVAMLAARNALPRARGYIPAYVLAIKCGARGGDLPWALAAALAAADQAIDPVPFFKTMVEIKSADKARDAELLKALEFLKEHDKGDSQWAERLGWLYFENRDLKRALTVLMPVITEDLRTVKVQSLLQAAEAARWEGNSVRAIDILEAAHAMYPKRMAVLNNLVYNLAQQPKTLERARTLLPGLLAMGEESFVVYDTASMVHLQSGQMDLAKQYMEKAQKLIDKDDYAAPEVGLNAARVLLRAGDYEAARRKVDEVRRNPLTSPALDVEARMTMDQIRAALNK